MTKYGRQVWLGLGLLGVLACTTQQTPSPQGSRSVGDAGTGGDGMVGISGASAAGAPSLAGGGGQAGAATSAAGQGAQHGAYNVCEGAVPPKYVSATCCGDQPCNGKCSGTTPNPVCGCSGPPCNSPEVCCTFLSSCVNETTCQAITSGQKRCDGTQSKNTINIETCCNGEPCQGWCNQLPDGHESCECYGLDSGCLGGAVCCRKFQGCTDNDQCDPSY